MLYTFMHTCKLLLAADICDILMFIHLCLYSTYFNVSVLWSTRCHVPVNSGSWDVVAVLILFCSSYTCCNLIFFQRGSVYVFPRCTVCCVNCAGVSYDIVAYVSTCDHYCLGTVPKLSFWSYVWWADWGTDWRFFTICGAMCKFFRLHWSFCVGKY